MINRICVKKLSINKNSRINKMHGVMIPSMIAATGMIVIDGHRCCVHNVIDDDNRDNNHWIYY